MGINGLWPLVEPTAQPVTLESVEGKRFAIDVSIWLHQAAAGYAYQLEARSPHLDLLLRRLSKLLFYKIRPVFVFDGPNVPVFKQRILRDRQVRRHLEEITLTKAQKRALKRAFATQDGGDESSREQWKTAFLSPKKMRQEDQMFVLPSATVKKSSEVNTMEQSESDEELEVLYSSTKKNDSTSGPEEALFGELISRDERVNRLLVERDRARGVRLTADDVPDDSMAFCGFQLGRLLKRKRINDQIKELKQEALGQTVSQGSSSQSSQNVKLAVMEGLNRGHFLVMDSDVQVVEEVKATTEPVICQSNTWPENLRKMEGEVERQSSFNEGLLPESNDNFVEEIEDDDNDNALQHAIELSLEATNRRPKRSSTVAHNAPRTSKSDVVDRIRKAFVSRRQDLLCDTWSESSPSSSGEDDFVDVEDFPKLDFEPRASSSGVTVKLPNINAKPNSFDSTNGLGTSSSSASNLKMAGSKSKTVAGSDEVDGSSSQEPEQEEEWNPDYLSEFSNKPSTSYSILKTNENLETNKKEAMETLRQLEGVYKECQDLLQHCGIPFVVAPGEAEAQCCELERLGIVQGIVSDDSDVWLFGADKVYRHMFNQKRRLQLYTKEAIRKELGITRCEMIQIAMLSGGDYTPGLENVGVVTALELSAEFAIPSDTGDSNSDVSKAFQVLQRISDWINFRENGIKISQESEKSAGTGFNAKSGKQLKEDGATAESPRKKNRGSFETARRIKLRRILEDNNDAEVLERFPSHDVFQAYAYPEVDSSAEKPSWGIVDMKKLGVFVWEKLGWNDDYLRKQTQNSLHKWNDYVRKSAGGGGGRYQTHITSFAHTLQKSEDDQRLAPSARVLTALKRLAAAKKTGGPSPSLICRAGYVSGQEDEASLDEPKPAVLKSTESKIVVKEKVVRKRGLKIIKTEQEIGGSTAEVTGKQSEKSEKPRPSRQKGKPVEKTLRPKSLEVRRSKRKRAEKVQKVKTGVDNSGELQLSEKSSSED